MAKTLVIGSTGTVGTELVRLLEQKGHDVVRATRKEPTQPGQVQLDLTTHRGVAQAFDGVERAFFLSPPGFSRQDQLMGPLIDQAATSGLRKVVLMTAMGANADENAPMRKAERHLEGSGLAYNIIRPNGFMQNFNSFWIRGILEQGKILLPVGQAKGSFIDARDIAAVAAELLSRDEFDGRDFDLTGAEALDHDQVAALLSRETGRAIAFQDIEPQAMLGALLEAGLPSDYAEFLLVILGFFKAGHSERTTDAVQTITERAPRSFAQYAKDYRTAWLG